MHSSVDKYRMYNTLTGLVAGLENEYTTIDLRNESYVSGKIIRVDGQMNIELEDVTFHDPKGVEHFHPMFYVCARTIRHVHIPEKFTAQQLFERQKAKMTKIPTRKQHTFKASRARKYHEQTTKELQETK